MTEEDSSFARKQDSAFQPSPNEVHAYKAIIGIGVAGTEEDVTRFTALWVADSEKRAHQINDKIFRNRLTLLPLPETDAEEAEVQDVPEAPA